MSTTFIPQEMLKGTPMERFERILKRIVSASKKDSDRHAVQSQSKRRTKKSGQH